MFELGATIDEKQQNNRLSVYNAEVVNPNPERTELFGIGAASWRS